MIRKCKKMISTPDGKRAIYIDIDNQEEILNYIRQDKRHAKKFKFITDVILSGLKNTEVYDKEEINKKCKNVTAMKFFKGQENDRIYCKEIKSETGTHIVVTSVLHERKKSQGLSSKEIAIIEKIGGYDYEIQG